MGVRARTAAARDATVLFHQQVTCITCPSNRIPAGTPQVGQGLLGEMCSKTA